MTRALVRWVFLAAALWISPSVGAEDAHLSRSSLELDLRSLALADPTPEPPPQWMSPDLRWVIADPGEGVTQKDAARVHRGRILLATGIPPIVTGLLSVAWSRPAKKDKCYLSGRDSLWPGPAAQC